MLWILGGLAASALVAIVLLYRQGEDLKDRLDDAQEDVKALSHEVERAERAIIAAEEASERRETATRQGVENEAIIREQPDTSVCADSPSVRAAARGLRERRRARQGTSSSEDSSDPD